MQAVIERRGDLSDVASEPPGIGIRTSLACRVEADFACSQVSPEDWDKATADLGGSVYMAFDWVRTWWEFYGAGKELRIFVFSVGDAIVGIVPLYIDPLGFGPVRLRIARLVGSNIPPKVFNPPIREEWAQPIFEIILNQLLEKDQCDILSFGPVSELQKSIGILEGVCRQGNKVGGALEVERGVHSVFSLPASMEEYYASLSKNERKNRRKYDLKMMRKEYEVSVEVLSDREKVEAEFECFAKQHAEQWRAEGKTGHFGAWPRGLEFNRALVRTQARLGRLRFIRIIANGDVIANQYVFAFGDTYFWELPSRAADPKWERFSLGPTGVVTMIDAAIQEGKKRLEGGLAHYDYKLRLGAKEHEVRTVRVTARRAGSRIRARLFALLRSLFSVAYHKIWYRRLAPRLPAKFWQSQWSIWLRFDF